jgi:hypothetical protein
MHTSRPLHLVLLLAAIGTLPACAGTKHRATAKAGKQEAVVIVRPDDPFAYRFDMTQRGKKMSADDFEAWMKARGLRIAKGGPASKDPKAKATAKRKRD